MPHRHTARVDWQRQPGEAFTDRRYARRHRLRFDGGAEIAGSSSPAVVPPPLSDAAAVDPEELFVAALASCHMLWFLDFASRAGWVVESYEDEASGEMARRDDGRWAIVDVLLRPRVVFAGAAPDSAALHALHEAAHDECFIANSVNCPVRCIPLD